MFIWLTQHWSAEFKHVLESFRDLPVLVLHLELLFKHVRENLEIFRKACQIQVLQGSKEEKASRVLQVEQFSGAWLSSQLHQLLTAHQIIPTIWAHHTVSTLVSSWGCCSSTPNHNRLVTRPRSDFGPGRGPFNSMHSSSMAFELWNLVSWSSNPNLK